IQAHRVTMAAVTAAAGTDYPGEPWSVPKVYWTVVAKSALAEGLAALGDIPPDWIRVAPDELGFGYADEDIDAVVEAPDQLAAKVAALRAHRTQVSVAPDGASFALSNRIVLPIGAVEHYVLAAGRSGERDARGWETDLLAGLNLG
ncbi:MAG: N-acetyl-1-D-myo-inositol-2-amino-2-deoxy-alpha-D-glucopyranoside deacetylase, partial [Mycolicibacterium hassiacum]